jgi:RNA polymerase sigma factor (sigma-70 family)
MIAEASGTLAGPIQSLFTIGTATGLSDRHLLERFVARSDAAGEAAFAALVARHGAMVLAVCRQLLRDPHDAEDAFQAVFLVLARRAGSIRDPERLGNWLYGVAIRTARKARTCSARRRRTEGAQTTGDLVEPTDADAIVDATASPIDTACSLEEARALHDEIARLPGRLRAPLVLCYLEGLTHDEAARRLRCPLGTIHSRLTRARDRLRRGLRKRGLGQEPAVLSMVGIGAEASRLAAGASRLPSLACLKTAKMAATFTTRRVGGPAASAVAVVLAEEVLSAMVQGAARVTALAVLALLAATTGAVVAGQAFFSRIHAAAGEQGPVHSPASRKLPTATVPGAAPSASLPALASFEEGNNDNGGLALRLPVPDQKPDPDPTDSPRDPIAAENPDADPDAPRMTVSGRVLDPSGQGIPNAAVMVYLNQRRITPTFRTINELVSPQIVARVQTNAEGRFRADAPRTSSTTSDRLGAVALAKGFGASWIELDRNAEEPTAEIKLPAEQVFHGRLVDASGNPARDVEVEVGSINKATGESLGATERYSSLTFWYLPRPKILPAWPAPARTDAEGRFTIRNLMKNRQVYLGVGLGDFRFARKLIEPTQAELEDGKETTFTLETARIIKGRVTYADTGKPVSRARVQIGTPKRRTVDTANGPQEQNVILYNDFLTDTEGRFRVNPYIADEYHLVANSVERQPYLSVRHVLKWLEGETEKVVDLALPVIPGGVSVRGRVVDGESGEAITNALVAFHQPDKQEVWSRAWGPLLTGKDGQFEFTALPRPGVLSVWALSKDYTRENYILEQIDARKLRRLDPEGLRAYAHAFVPQDLKPGDPPHDVTISLRRGETARINLIRPDGDPVAEALVFSPAILGHPPSSLSLWNGLRHEIARDGVFELSSLAPDRETPAFFIDLNNRLGATIRLSGKAAEKGPITVRLEPCGSARFRAVDSEGQAVPGYRVTNFVSLVGAPGLPHNMIVPEDDPRLGADEIPWVFLDRDRVLGEVVSDAEGWATVPGLIPDASYRIYDRSRPRPIGDVGFRKEFTARSGETVDLGEILIEKPTRP